jgi:hypothetical protein
MYPTQTLAGLGKVLLQKRFTFDIEMALNRNCKEAVAVTLAKCSEHVEPF